MNYLAFQPAFDVFHTEFRFLRLRRLMEADSPWHYEQLRIADFYLLFFFRIQSARLSPKHRAIRSLALKKTQERYEYQPDDRLLFGRMEEIQFAAMGTLIAKGFFSAEAFKRDLVLETGKEESEALSMRIETINESDADVMEAIQSLITDYKLLGADGLKHRTGLLEYRYDAV